MMVKARPSPDAIDGWQVSVVAKKVHAANCIVTEFMLAANEAMAMYGDTHGVLMPFRCQEMDEVLEAGIEATPGSVSKLAGHTVYFSIGNSIKSSTTRWSRARHVRAGDIASSSLCRPCLAPSDKESFAR